LAAGSREQRPVTQEAVASIRVKFNALTL